MCVRVYVHIVEPEGQTSIFKCSVAQGKRVGLITQRSEDRNLFEQNLFTCTFCIIYVLVSTCTLLGCFYPLVLVHSGKTLRMMIVTLIRCFIVCTYVIFFFIMVCSDNSIYPTYLSLGNPVQFFS